jgi:hypothetical protein
MGLMSIAATAAPRQPIGSIVVPGSDIVDRQRWPRGGVADPRRFKRRKGDPMLRRVLITASVALATTMWVAVGRAAEITSTTSSIHNVGEVFSFDFTGDPDVSLMDANSDLMSITANWTFTPGAGATGNVDLSADLHIANQNTGVGFRIGFNQSVGAAQAQAINSASTGLNFGGSLLESLLSAPAGKVDGVLSVLGPDVSDLVDFFSAGGRIDASLTLLTHENDPGGSGGAVPEPGSVLIWGLVGLGAFGLRRLRRSK